MSPEPTPVADAISPELRKRLEDRGVSLDPTPPSVVETPQEAEERRLRAQEGTRARWVRRLPPMYATATLDDLDPPLVWPASSLNLVLAGGVGVGKTHAAYAQASALVPLGLSCEAWTVADLLEVLRPSDHKAERAQAEYWTRRADVLILDDLGATKVSDWAVETLTALMDARLREGLRTIVTTNCTEDQLEAAWGGRMMDRLRYRRTVKVLLGESRRRGEF